MKIMNLNKFYVLVDTEKKIIIDKIQELPEYWNNISNLSALSNEELENLDWSGNKNLGWMNITSQKLKFYEIQEDTLTLNKNAFKELISKERKIKQDCEIFYKNISFTCNQKTILFLSLKKYSNNKIFNYKSNENYYQINIDEINEIYTIMNEHIQKCFDWEKKITDQLEKITKVTEFAHINYDF